MTVVAHIDTGVNPYNKNFRDRSALAYKHPSTYIPGFPKEAQALKLHLDMPYEKAFALDEDLWKTVRRGELYWIPGTKIMGAISFGSGGTSCPETIKAPVVSGFDQGDCSEHVILDDAGHGSMTASRSTGNLTSLAPDARLVTIEGLGAKSVEWAADQGWIDVQTNSWLSLVPPPVPSAVTDAFARAASLMPTLAASGNGSAYLAGVAPTPTYLLSTAPPGVILVGGHDNGKSTLWSGAPPHVVADAYAGPTAIFNSSTEVRPDPISCCTSAASPYAAGGAAALILEARRILGDRTTGVRDGIIAEGRCGAVETGPLADGDFTLAEFKDLFFHTAEPHPQEGEHDGLIHWAGEPRVPDNAEYGP
ncbi:MAG: S8/S53 family peptidase, partial [Actinobacteria bacterium]|nr:S8/S53 family peptidase [Actinomycetota bacterium]